MPSECRILALSPTPSPPGNQRTYTRNQIPYQCFSPIDRGIAIVLKSTKGYKGKLEFDIPRYQAYMGFKHDWPRMNTMPEWFTVEPDRSYSVKNMATGKIGKYTGQQLHEGIPIDLVLNQEVRLTLSVIGK
jgi:hypothetical protein